jgi:hypothetical protein
MQHLLQQPGAVPLYHSNIAERASWMHVSSLRSFKVNNVENHFSNKSKENNISELISKADTDFTIKDNIDSKVEDHFIQG